MSKVALVTVHGMGVTKESYADGLIAGLQKRMGDKYAAVKHYKVYYQTLLQDNERQIWEDVEENAKVRYHELRKFLLYGFGDAAGLENRKEQGGSMYEQAQLTIANALLMAFHNDGPDTPVVFITHSLGCHVLSSYLYDAQKFRDGGQASAGIWTKDHPFIAGLSAEQKKFLWGDTAMGWITTGCNIPIFVAAHKKVDIVPIKPPRDGFKWLNLYDPDDVLGWPLEPLSPSYRKLVEDVAINAGHGMLGLAGSWNPLSHTLYWEDDDVIKPLAAMLTQLTH